jgi:hypothetical protein
VTESVIVPLKRGASGEIVDAQLTERVDIAFASRADSTWQAFLGATKATAAAGGAVVVEAEHEHWQWERKVKATVHLLPYPTFGLECDGDVQGLMLLATDGQFCRLPESRGSPLVQVLFVAAAPWNVRPIVSQPRFCGVGTLLLRVAIETSVDVGFKGRIGLHSLQQAEPWYERIGMTGLGPDSKKSGLKYYEMTAPQAAEFLR